MIITHVIGDMLCSCPSQQLDQAERTAPQYRAPQLTLLTVIEALQVNKRLPVKEIPIYNPWEKWSNMPITKVGYSSQKDDDTAKTAQRG